jgi:hypothetical protein
MMRTLLVIAALVVSSLAAAKADDIPSGRLGYRLGTYLTIEGVRAETFKAGVNTLLVDTVNGKKLDTPLGIWIENVESLPKATRCILRGYESGRMIGIPHGVAAKENLPLPQAAWQFFRYFLVTSVVEPKELKKKGPPQG